MPTTSDAVGSAFEKAMSRAVNDILSSLVRKALKKAAEEMGIGQLVREMTELTKEPWTSNAYKTVEAAAKVEDELKRINSLLPDSERFDFERRGRFIVYPKRVQEHIETAEKNCDVLGIQLSDHMLFEQESNAELDRVKSDTIPRLNREFGGEWEGVLIRDELKRAVDTEFAAKLAEELRDRGVFCSASNGVLVFRISDTDAIIRAAETALGGEARLVDQLKRELNPDKGDARGEAPGDIDMHGPATLSQLKFLEDLHKNGEISDAEMATFNLDGTARAASDLLTSHGRELKEKSVADKAPSDAPAMRANTAMANTLSVLAADNMIDADKYARFEANMIVANFHLCIEKGADSLAEPDALQRRAAELMQQQGVPIAEDDYASVERLRWAMDRRPEAPVRATEELDGLTRDLSQAEARADAGETVDLSGAAATTDMGRGDGAVDFESRTEAVSQVMDVPGTDEKTHVDGTQTTAAPAEAHAVEPQRADDPAPNVGSGEDIATQSMEALRREDVGNTQATADYVQSRPDTGDQDRSTPYGDGCDPAGAGDKDGNGIRDAAEDRDGDGIRDADDADFSRPERRYVDEDMYPVVEQEDLDDQIASAETTQHLDSRSDRGIETHNDRTITGR